MNFFFVLYLKNYVSSLTGALRYRSVFINLVTLFVGLLPIASFAQGIVLPGPAPHYDEATALENLQRSSRIIEEQLAKVPPDHASGFLRFLSSKDCPELIDLAWTLIAVGEHSRGSEALKQTLFSIQAKLGHLSVPYWVCSEARREQIALFHVTPADTMQTSRIDEALSEQLIYLIAVEAERAITQRSGFRFEGYSGPSYGKM